MTPTTEKPLKLQVTDAMALWLAFIGANMACLGLMAFLLIV